MTALTIRDDALWTRHISDPGIRGRVDQLAAGARLRLVVDGRSILFCKMADGKDGRPTPGLKADPDDAESRTAWASLQARRGQTVSVELDERTTVDPYLAYLDELFWEWNTPGDAEAFDDL